MTMQLTRDLASTFCTVALNHVTREYPNKLTHTLSSLADAQGPQSLHPIFYGSYDWHSCVHGYWLMARLIHRYPDLPQAEQIIALFDAHLTPQKVAGELAYLTQAQHRGFERPYGWAWCLALGQQLQQWEQLPAERFPNAQRWAEAFVPITSFFADSFEAYLAIAHYPNRVGTHFNTAFALVLALDFARSAGRQSLVYAIESAARRWHEDDRACQAWEPGGDEFLSPALMEAELMRRVLGTEAFTVWLSAFLPELAKCEPATLFTPASVSDRSDGKIAHLDGLNLSRAWCQRAIGQSLPYDDARRAVLMDAAQLHLQSALPHIAGDYMGEHWLATFAVLALEA